MKKAFTLIELAMTMVVMISLSTLMLFGVNNARRGEGLKADYNEFFEDLKAIKARTNLGQIVNPDAARLSQTTVHRFDFGGSSYTINQGHITQVTKTFKNGSCISRVNGTANGTGTILFYPDNNYVGVHGTFFATVNGGAHPSTVTIEIAKTCPAPATDLKYALTVSGNSYLINSISRQ
jgi:hypothetical protein